MALRKPISDSENSREVIQDELNALQLQSDGWQRYQCELVTPMYGGGVEAGTVDRLMPIRAAGIRGQLRFWWRVAHRQQFIKDGQMDHQTMFQRERELWGGLGNFKELTASKVMVRVSKVNPLIPKLEAAYPFIKHRDGKYNESIPEWVEAYSLFSTRGKLNHEKTKIEEYPKELAQKGLNFQLEIRLDKKMTKLQKSEVETAVC